MSVREWTEQLYRDYDTIVWRHGLKLRRPLIEIDSSLSHLGQWDGQLRRIRIARSLIESHPWDVVLGVLRHEVAHQISHEVLGKGDGHGPFFRTACELAGVPAEFRGATVDTDGIVPDWRRATVPEHEAALLRKVEKLLAVAGSSNEHEALLAMQRVQQIFARHNYARLKEKSQPASSYVSLVISTGRQRVSKIHRLVSSILCSHYFVSVIFTELYHAASLQTHKAIEVLGARQNVLMAEYVYHFLMRQVESLWSEYQARKPERGRQRLSYQTGLLVGFRKKLERTEQELAADSTRATQEAGFCTAVAKLRDRSLEAFIRSRYPKLSTHRQGSSRVDRATYEAGCEAGERIVLREGVSSTQPRSRGLLLT